MKTLVPFILPSLLAAASNGGRSISEFGLYQGASKFILGAKSDAGTNPTLAVKLQNAPTQLRTPTLLADGDTAIEHRTATDTAIKLAASFTLDETTTLAAVFLRLTKNGAPTGTLTLAIQADDTGEPDGTDIVTATLDAATVSTDVSNAEFRFTTPEDLAAGDYWIVLTSTVALSASVNIEWKAGTVANGGNSSTFDAAWAADDTKNLEFFSESYVFADITDGDFAQVTTTGSLEMIEINASPLAFVRPHITVGGTDTPAFYLDLSAVASAD